MSENVRSGAPEPIAYSIRDAARASALSRSKIYLLLKSGALRGHKSGKRTLISARSLKTYLDRLPVPAIGAGKGQK